MKFTAAFLALAAGAMAHKSFDTESASSTSTGSFIESATPSVTYTTEIVTAITTYCPGPTTLTHGGSTYTVTEATTLTISDCPCTIKKPITVISSVVCSSCPSSSSTVAPSFVTSSSAPSSTKSVGTVTRSAPSSTKTSPPIQTAGAGKAAALSGGALAGVLGFAALVL